MNFYILNNALGFDVILGRNIFLEFQEVLVMENNVIFRVGNAKHRLPEHTIFSWCSFIYIVQCCVVHTFQSIVENTIPLVIRKLVEKIERGFRSKMEVCDQVVQAIFRGANKSCLDCFHGSAWR